MWRRSCSPRSRSWRRRAAARPRPGSATTAIRCSRCCRRWWPAPAGWRRCGSSRPRSACCSEPTPPRAALARVGIADALRRPTRPLATVAFLVAACALAIFATSYRSTLRTGAADQAAFVVPLDARLTTGPSLALPLDLASMQQYGALAPRRAGDARRAALGRRPHRRHRARPGAARRARSGDAAADRALPQRHVARRPWRACSATTTSRSPAPRCRPARPRCASTPPAPRTSPSRPSWRAPTASSGRSRCPGRFPSEFRGGQFVGLLIRESQSGISAILHHIGEGATEVEKRQVAIGLKSVIAEPGGPLAARPEELGRAGRDDRPDRRRGSTSAAASTAARPSSARRRRSTAARCP